MATAINLDSVTTSGCPLSDAAITVGAGVEEVITFSNCPKGGFSLVLFTTATDMTYGFATTEMGGKLVPSGETVIQAFNGRQLFINSAAGAPLYLRRL